MTRVRVHALLAVTTGTAVYDVEVLDGSLDGSVVFRSARLPGDPEDRVVELAVHHRPPGPNEPAIDDQGEPAELEFEHTPVVLDGDSFGVDAGVVLSTHVPSSNRSLRPLRPPKPPRWLP